jgi:hyperosmotically inducible protein
MRTAHLLPLLLIALLLVPDTARAQLSDADLGERVAESVRTYSSFGIFDDVNVVVENHAVTLMGRVTTPRKREDLGARVAKVDGVKSVTNQIGVLPVSQSDDRLRVRIANAIYSHPSFWQYAQMANPPIHIIIEHGQITLTGAVGSETERQLAYSLAQVPGAFTVTNKIRRDAR